MDEKLPTPMTQLQEKLSRWRTLQGEVQAANAWDTPKTVKGESPASPGDFQKPNNFFPGPQTTFMAGFGPATVQQPGIPACAIHGGECPDLDAGLAQGEGFALPGVPGFSPSGTLNIPQLATGRGPDVDVIKAVMTQGMFYVITADLIRKFITHVQATGGGVKAWNQFFTPAEAVRYFLAWAVGERF